ncbi:hypothetical protein CL622_08135 [archaeon]|nr:hypothetical protein [archaeon]
MSNHITIKKMFLISLIISLSIGAILGIVIFLIGNFGEIQLNILLTTLTIGGFSLTGLCCATLLEKKRFSAFAIMGMIFSAWGFLFITSLIWNIFNFSSLDTIGKLFFISIILAFSSAHASLLLLIKSEKSIVNVFLIATLIFIFLVSLELIILVLSGFDVDLLWWRVLGIFAILDVLGTIVTPILLKVTDLHHQENQLKTNR